jgi:hypothetical protein
VLIEIRSGTVFSIFRISSPYVVQVCDRRRSAHLLDLSQQLGCAGQVIVAAKTVKAEFNAVREMLLTGWVTLRSDAAGAAVMRGTSITLARCRRGAYGEFRRWPMTPDRITSH